MLASSAAIAAGSAGEKTVEGGGAVKSGEDGGRRKRRGRALTFLLPCQPLFCTLFSTLFLGKGREMGEVIRGMGGSLVHLQSHHLALTPQEFRALLKAWGRLDGLGVW